MPARSKVWELQEPDRVRRFTEAWEAGVTLREMCERFGFSRATLYDIHKRLGLPKRQVQVRVQDLTLHM
jgi:hypothetical protein